MVLEVAEYFKRKNKLSINRDSVGGKPLEIHRVCQRPWLTENDIITN